MYKILSLFFILFSNFAYPFTSAWLQPEYKTYVSITAQPFIACKSWNNVNVLENTPCFKLFTLEPYLEYGIFSWLTFVFDSYFETFSQSDAKRPFNLQNITPALKFLVWHNTNNIVSLLVSYNQPFQSQFFMSGVMSVPEPFFFDGQEQILLVPTNATAEARASLEKYLDARILYGIKSKNKKAYNGWYANAQVAYRQYFDGAADQIHFDWDFGFKTVQQKLTIEFQNLNTFGLHNPKNMFYPDYDLFDIQLSVLYDFYEFFGAAIGIEQSVFGRNVGRGTSPYASVYFSF